MNRRELITGLISLVAAPAIVRAGSLMPVKLMEPVPRVFAGTIEIRGLRDAAERYNGLGYARGDIYVGNQRVEAGHLRAGGCYAVVYDGRHWQLIETS